MNSTPTVIEQPALSRADMYKGLVSAYVIVRKVAYQQFDSDEDHTACLRVCRYLERAMNEHLHAGTAFERKL